MTEPYTPTEAEVLHDYAYVPLMNEEGEDVGYLDMERRARFNRFIASVKAAELREAAVPMFGKTHLTSGAWRELRARADRIEKGADDE